MQLQATIRSIELTKESGYFSISFDVAGRIAHSGFFLHSPNARTTEQGQQALSALCRATGVMQIKDTEQLIGKSLIVEAQEVKGKCCGNLLVVVGW